MESLLRVGTGCHLVCIRGNRRRWFESRRICTQAPGRCSGLRDHLSDGGCKSGNHHIIGQDEAVTGLRRLVRIDHDRRLSLEAEAGGLRDEAVGSVGGSAAGVAHWPGSDHEAVAQDRGVVLHLLLLRLPGLAGLVVGLQNSKLLGLLGQHIDHVRHCEIIQTIAPGEFQDKVGAEEVVARVQYADVALAVANIDELRLG